MNTTTKITINLADLGTKHPEVLAWIATGKGDFATSLNSALKRFKVLTEGQLNAVLKIIAKPAPVSSKVDAGAMAPVQAAFDSAIESGIKRPKLRLADIILAPAKAGGANAGAIYVNDAEKNNEEGQRLYLGKIMAGQFTPAKACTPARQSDIIKACENPLKEAIAYGRRTGTCACCGRELTDPVSIERGIGPVCAANWFGA